MLSTANGVRPRPVFHTEIRKLTTREFFGFCQRTPTRVNYLSKRQGFSLFGRPDLEPPLILPSLVALVFTGIGNKQPTQFPESLSPTSSEDVYLVNTK